MRLASRAALARKPGRLGGAGSRRSRGRARAQRWRPAGSAGASRALVTAPISCCRKRIGNAILTFALGKESLRAQALFSLRTVFLIMLLFFFFCTN